MVIAGAIGNLIDRLFLGEVIDFLDFMQSEILSLNSDNDSSNTFVITLIEQPLIYTSMF